MADELATTYEKCVHFRGIQNPCGAGVALDTVKDTSGPGPYRWPCLQLIGRPLCRTTCPARRLMTEAEQAAESATIDAAVKAAMASLTAGKCHECSAPIEPSKVVGRCRYASCGHRVGQVESSEEP